MEELKTISGLAQLGSFAVLVYIVYWTLRYVPKHMDGLAAERKEARESIDRDRQNNAQMVVLQAAEHKLSLEKLVVENRAVVDSLTTKYVEQIRYEREECERKYGDMVENSERKHAELVKTIMENFRTVLGRLEQMWEADREIRHSINNIAHNRAIEKLAAEVREKEKTKPQSPRKEG